ncbi:VOC family protein [uncultured Schumannella sp.]|uniref:VOC family protein n=1 Tax=uncultured Schumannella sp. TaxID=1195956 RepID=UPI0025FC21F8|nr:VOC family protein [uncultured Schumannella sp.]
MLKQIHTVLPAKDLTRARTFYHDKLGLDPAEEHEGMLSYSAGGSSFDIYETENAGSAKNTQMCWVTDDLATDVRELRDHGVVFEEYDVPGMMTKDGIATMDDGSMTAWFRDSEGNFICLTQYA